MLQKPLPPDLWGYVCIGVLGLLVGLLARQKGFSFPLWFFAGPAVVIAVLALGALPAANGPGQTPEEQARARRNGNIAGAVLAVVSIAGLLLLPALQRSGQQ